MKAPEPKKAAPRMLTSFLRLDFDRAKASGDLDLWNNTSSLVRKPQQTAMLAFSRSPEFNTIPGGWNNLINVKVYGKDIDCPLDFTLTLKRSPLEITAEAEREAVRKIQKAEALLRAVAVEVVLAEASKALRIPLADLKKKPFAEVKKLVEAHKRKVAEKQVAKSSPPIEFKPAQITGRRVALPDKKIQSMKRSA